MLIIIFILVISMFRSHIVETKFTRKGESEHFKDIYPIDFIKSMAFTSERYYPKELKMVFGQNSN